MDINHIAKQSLLYDFYGALLSERQRQVLELYNEENLTLAEIAAEFGISRQGVHDALKNGQKALEEYEDKLGLLEKFRKTSNIINEISEKIDEIIADEDCGHREVLLQIKSIIDELEE